MSEPCAPDDAPGDRRSRAVKVEVVLQVRRDACGRGSVRVLAGDSDLDFGVVPLGDLPLLLEALLTDAWSHESTRRPGPPGRLGLPGPS